MKVIKNTYPVFEKVPHAEPGDQVHWEHGTCFRLIRDSDRRTVFSTAPVDKDGKLRSNGQPPTLVGIIAQVKSKGWVLEIKKEDEDDRDDEEKYYPKGKGGKKCIV